MFTGVTGLLGLGNLINASAVATLKANAYQAAKALLKGASEEALNKAVDQYAAFVVPKTNRALSTYEILHDYNFTRIAKAAKDDSGIKAKVEQALDMHDLRLGGSALFGIPNIILYGGLGYLGYRYYKKKKGGDTKGLFGFFKKKHTTRHRTSRRTSLPPPTIGG